MRNRIYNDLWKSLHLATGATGRNRNNRFEALFSDTVMQLGPDICLEVGAHAAEFSREMRRRLPGAQIVAYEGNPFVYERYKDALSRQIDYRNSVVAGDTQDKTLFIPRQVTVKDEVRTLPTGNKISSILERENADVLYDEVICRSTTVDNEVEALLAIRPGSRAVLWIDVEGAIGDVLEGGREALGNTIDATYIELEDRRFWKGQWLARDVEDYLEGLGFCLLARDCEEIFQYNAIFMREHCLTEAIAALVLNYTKNLLAAER
jgi:FkbM family methyltransferase